MEEERSIKSRVNLTLILGGIFALALFIRAYFAYDLAIKDFLVSGGSDAYYYGWTIEHIVTTGKHLLRDNMLNFPVGMNNPRPPIYGWSVALTGMLLGHLQGSIQLGIGQSFLFSTAVWGALTIFPTYFLGKAIFGQRAGLVAAFFLAILAAHIQRSPLSNGDHDALVLFFAVTSFYFFLRALSELKEKRWVGNWASPTAIYRGLKQLLLESRRTVLFSIMAGASVATVALTWQGWAYVPVVIIAYFIVQLLVHKLRNQDPLGVLLVFTVTLGTALLMAAPYYVATGFVRTWFDVPLILFAAALGLGLLVTVFHRLPWMLVIPSIVFGFVVGLAIASIYSPVVGQALTSGFGYFAPDKVYQTISEAQPPELSQAILSFGAVTYWLSLLGIAWMAIQFIRRPRSDYLFVLAWSAAAIFMAMSAVRFLFNASPAFAITSAWITVMIVERLGFEQVRKAVAATGGSRLTALRKGIKLRHIAGGLFVALLLILPNTWYAVDAAVPFEKKQELELEVYNSIPAFLRPPDYQEGQLFYFGAFGYTLPLKTRYFPQAWEWLRQQDAEILPFSDRPAFLSWWDYGFESIQEGRHPAVADNFQNGYEFSGAFLLAQSENEGIAILNTRLLQGDIIRHGRQLSEVVKQALERSGLDPVVVADALLRPSAYIPLIRSEPERFGEWDILISGRNARVIFLKTLFTEQLDVDGQAELYRDLRLGTGTSVGYFAVDSRLVPFSGTNTGIFYAPVKLTDHRTAELPDLRSIPVDFYRLVAETNLGEFDLDQVPPTAQISNIRIEYREMFYDSMLYRIFFGQKGSDVGLDDDGLPGISGPLRSETPLHGWMLKHFKLVYRTAYFNPYPPEEVANRTGDWTAMNLLDTAELAERIQRGEAEGTLDTTPAGNLLQGIVILEYYDGAILRGAVTTEEGRPLERVRITVLDELSIPHDVAMTDSAGFYEVILPFGDVRVVASVGDLDNRTQVGSVILALKSLEIRDDQAARIPLDIDGDGRLDYIVEENFRVKGSAIVGKAFLDLNGNSIMEAEEEGLEGLEVEVLDPLGGEVTRVLTGSDGEYEIADLTPGSYSVFLMREGRGVAEANVSLLLGEVKTQDLPVPSGGLSGKVVDEFRQAAAAALVELVEEATGLRTEVDVDEEGNYTLEGLFEGNYTLGATLEERSSLQEKVRITAGTTPTRDLVVRPMGDVTVRTVISFRPTPFVTFTLRSREGGSAVSLTTDSSGRFQTKLPEGTYDAYSLHFDGGKVYSFLGSLTVSGGDAQSLEVSLEPAVRVDGHVTQEGGAQAEGATITFEVGGATRTVTADEDGLFLIYLSRGSYRVWSLHQDEQYVAPLMLDESATLDISLSQGTLVEGRLFHDLNGNGTWDPGEGLEGVRIRLSDASGNAFSVSAREEGEYGAPLLSSVEYTLSIEERGFQPLSLGPFTPAGLANQSVVELRPERVRVEGNLVPLDTLETEGTPILFTPLGDGAVLASATADSAGLFSLELLPGLYGVVVDDGIGDGGDDVRLQNLEEETLRVPLGKSVDSLRLEVVRRVRVDGYLDLEGSPFEGNLSFSGAEEASVPVDGNFTAYLRPGTYTLFATTQVEGKRYLLLNHTSIISPTNFTSSLDEAAVLDGTVRVAGRPVTNSISLNFLRTDGARLTLDTTASGSYLAALGPGTYEISIEWRGADRIDKALRFVRYSLSQEIAVVVGESQTLDLEVSRSLDNSTLTGAVLLSGQTVSARITFQAANETALDAVFDVAGFFDISLGPGIYDVYAYRESGKSVNLTTLEVVPYVGNQATIQLEPGYRVSGIVSLDDGSRERATIEFASTASADFTTDESGIFAVYLPTGQYRVTGGVQKLERGVQVDYSFIEMLDLRESTTLNLQLSRIDLPAVEIRWDQSEKANVDAGEVVAYSLTVTNIGNVADSFSLDATLEGWSFDFEPRVVTLPFGEDNEAIVGVTISTPEDARVDHDALMIEVRSTSDTNVRDSVAVDIGIRHERGISLQLSDQPPALSPQALEYELEILNEGNGGDTFTLVLINPETLATQGWQPKLLYKGESQEERVEGVEVPAQDSTNVTLRLEIPGAVSASRAVLLAFSEGDREVEAFLEVELAFPSLDIPVEEIEVEGRSLRLGAPEFPVFLYGILAAAAAIVAILLIRRRRRRSRR